MKDWNHIRLFLAVARAGTLTGAAAELGLGIATIHRHLASLEADLGSALFEKGPRGYRLTHVGETLLPQAEEVEEGILSASRTVIGHDQQASGEVRITMPPALLSEVALHFAEFSRQGSRIRLVLQDDVVPLDLKRETDLALRATTQPQDTAIGRKLCGLAWGRYASMAFSENELQWIHYTGMHSSPAIQWRRKHHPSLQSVMQVQGVMGMLYVLRTSAAQGLLPCFLGDRDPTLRRVGPPIAMDQLWLLVHADLRRSARVRAVIDFVVPRILKDRDLFEGLRHDSDESPV